MSEKIIWWAGKLPELKQLNLLNESGMPLHVGIEFTEIGPDFLTARMPVDHRTQQPFGRLHGGASVVLAETVGSVAASRVVDPQLSVAVGLEINANHVRPAFSGHVYGTATPLNLGRTTQIWSIRIEDEAGKLICISRFTAAVIPRERGVKN
ncbi:hotdog fold thioesterase [Altererythrobacter arenosus]|uniref:Hotdog fold thioesterase n=1 Tax=Altererythrobacter arenosus TaxID=3032592 RepID=A0ABY8FMH0_9SPHN|nr:hotdog fold thioesterase [Altererythrobacter sp. CAU 1644]WFL76224.1 hotdog fold thioesterase [Altererythrobacter sp. CAU 1644]